jgi:hypothetical protein
MRETGPFFRFKYILVARATLSRMVTVLETIDPSQSLREKILWELSTHGKMKKRDLRRCSGLRLSDLETILDELAREGRIGIDIRNIVSIIY